MRSPTSKLTRVAVYRRRVGASLERIWENVLDWEHLPWLHRSSFSDVAMQEAGAWGWRAKAVTAQGHEIGLELLIERDASRYVSRTLEGEGAGTEIWTQLRFRSKHETDIEVEFRLPNVPMDGASALGAAYTRLYSVLWDEDEAMMREREARLVRRRAAPGAEPVDACLPLGRIESLRAKLPLRVEFAGEPVWLVDLEGSLAAHSAVCPHRLGPLPAADGDGDRSGTIQCPWHGYRFDARTRVNCDGLKLRLKDAPRVVIEAGEVRLQSPPRPTPAEATPLRDPLPRH